MSYADAIHQFYKVSTLCDIEGKQGQTGNTAVAHEEFEGGFEARNAIARGHSIVERNELDL